MMSKFLMGFGTDASAYAGSYYTKPNIKGLDVQKIESKFSSTKLKAACGASVTDLLKQTEFINPGTRFKETETNKTWKTSRANKHTMEGRYGFTDNGSNILAVAHMDFVKLPYHFKVLHLATEKLIFCPRLDDRLGVYTIMDLLPRLGINVDVLLTDNEEIGMSSAAQFKTHKQYNWVVEFDRREDDVATYQYNIRELNKFFKTSRGSFSDIAELDFLGAQAFNVGVGYEKEHTNRCLMSLGVYFDQIARFVEFWKEYKDTHFQYEKPQRKKPIIPYSPYGGKPKSKIIRASFEPVYNDPLDKIYACSKCLSEFFESESCRGSLNTISCPYCGKSLLKRYAQIPEHML